MHRKAEVAWCASPSSTLTHSDICRASRRSHASSQGSHPPDPPTFERKHRGALRVRLLDRLMHGGWRLEPQNPPYRFGPIGIGLLLWLLTPSIIWFWLVARRRNPTLSPEVTMLDLYNTEGAMRRFVRLTMVLCTFATPLLGQQNVSPLKGVSKVTVAVRLTVSNRVPAPVGITEDRLDTFLQLRLRSAGIRVLSVDEDRADTQLNPCVYLDVTVIGTRIGAGGGILTGYAMSARVRMTLFARLATTGAVTPQELWALDNLTISPTTGADAALEQYVGNLLDDLMNDWLAANPKRE